MRTNYELNPLTDINIFLIDSILKYNIEGIKVAIRNGANIDDGVWVFNKAATYVTNLFPIARGPIQCTFYPGSDPKGYRGFKFMVSAFTKEEQDYMQDVITYLISVGARCFTY